MDLLHFYKPEASKEHTAAITDSDFDELQRKVLDVLSEKTMRMHSFCTIIAVIQVEQMFRRMVFNIVCVNKDDHAKNFSFLCENGKWTVAPAF